MRARCSVLFSWVLAGIPVAGFGAVIRVPADVATLTQAIAAAGSGDEIRIAAGRYSPSSGETFPLRLAGKSLRILGESAAATVLDAEEAAGVLEITAGDSSLVADVTLSGGRTDTGGGAVLVNGASPTLLRLILTDCLGGRDGDALFLRNGIARVSQCLFAANGASGPTVAVDGGAPTLERCTWAGNAGAAVELRDAAARVVRCVIAEPGEPTGRSVGVVLVAREADSAPSFADNLFSGCREGSVRVEGQAGSRLAAALDDARTMRGLRSGEARFVDPAHGDFRLQSRSSVRDRDVGAFGGASPLSPSTSTALVGVEGPAAGETLLGPTVPNPFAPQTTIHFTVPAPSVVDLGIYNVLGQRVRTLISGDLSAGEHLRDWNGRDDHGEELPPGMYFVRITIGDATESRRLVLVR